MRLIKGAYWDYEVIHAEQMGWPVPGLDRQTGDRRLFRADGGDVRRRRSRSGRARAA